MSRHCLEDCCLNLQPPAECQLLQRAKIAFGNADLWFIFIDGDFPGAIKILWV
jgi:hypothetical protein